MTGPTKILLSLIFAGTVLSHADVTAKDSEAVNFQPAATAETPKAADGADQTALTIRDELPDSQTEGGSCQIVCHPPFTGNSKTSLAKFDLGKIK